MAVDLYAEDPMEVPIAAELLGVTSRELVEDVYYRRIRYVIVNGIPLIPRSVLDEYRRDTSPN